MAHQHSPRFLQLCEEVRKRIPEVTVDQVQDMLQRRDNFVLVDVREESEWARDHLPGAMHLCKGIIERDIEQRVDALMPGSARGMPGDGNAIVQQSLASALGEVPSLKVVQLPLGADLEAAKARIYVGDAAGDAQKTRGRLALLRIHDDAIPAGDAAMPKNLGSYDLYVRDKLEAKLVDEIRSAAKQAIIEARMGSRRLDPEEIRALTTVPRVEPREIGANGEEDANEIASQMLPLAFMILIFMSVFTAGQSLMTSTIEEKSSRVVEVLLAAVSPTQLMAGKIIGQLGVGLLMLTVYAGLGVLGLLSLAMIGVLDPMQLVYLLVFFLIAFVTISALMAAIGSAVNELREAQTLLTPVMLVLMLPMMLWMPISRDPNGTLATVLSLLPPVSPFAMVLRISSSTPPPEWQIALAIAIGIAAVFAAVWFAGKVFRVGLLMHGKPPNFATLWRWVRMA